MEKKTRNIISRVENVKKNCIILLSMSLQKDLSNFIYCRLVLEVKFILHYIKEADYSHYAEVSIELRTIFIHLNLVVLCATRIFITIAYIVGIEHDSIVCSRWDIHCFYVVFMIGLLLRQAS